MAKAKKTVKRYSSNVQGDYVARATLSDVKVVPGKMELVLDLVRGMKVDPAMQVLKNNKQKGAKVALTVLKSAVANAKDKEGVDVDKLWITGAWAQKGRVLKRFLTRAQGRATQMLKRYSHVTICLGER